MNTTPRRISLNSALDLLTCALPTAAGCGPEPDPLATPRTAPPTSSPVTTRAPATSHAHKPAATLLLLVAILAVGAAIPIPVSAASDPYGADPLGLFADYEDTSYYTTRPDTFEVAICNPDHIDRTLQDIVDYLNEETGVREFYSSVSNGQYTVRFVTGTNVTTRGPAAWCFTEAQKQASGRHAAGFVLIPLARGSFAGQQATVGPSTGRTTWGGRESNGRFIQQAFWIFEHLTLIWHNSVARSMGRTFDWPHSFTEVQSDRFYHHYDNPMDMMSGTWNISGTKLDNDHFTGHKGGTIAANRYAAGWIDPTDVHVFRGGTDRITLNASWENGTQMLVVPSDEQGHFLTLGTRVAKHHDENIPKEGIESYLIDQRPGASPWERHDCEHTPCSGFHRRTIPYPHSAESYKDPNGISWPTDPTIHVNQPGDEFTWNNITIRVLSRTGDSYEVEITDGTPPINYFTDDNGSMHEADINQIAVMGITRGCATTPTARYCPDRSVTRAEMAAFLLRASGEPNPQPNISNTFSDVPEDVWYTNYVLRFAQLGGDTGSAGSWRPNDPLTRLEMAEWLTRMFDHISPAASPEGLFGDVNEDDWSVVEGPYHTGVTRGCSSQPLLYCPDEPVTRAQMASFIIKALS